MTTLKTKILLALSSIGSILALLFYFFKPSKHEEASQYDLTEKKEAEKKTQEIKDQIADLPSSYTDEEIEKKFNQ